MSSVERFNVLGVGISAINMDLALEQIENWLHMCTAQYVCVTNVHSIMECYHDETLQRFFNAAELVTPDGMPLVWLGHLMGFPHVRRVYGPDLMLALCHRSIEKGYRHFFYGNKQSVLDQLEIRLEQRFPGIQIVGTYAPPFDSLTSHEEMQVIQQINESGADIVWVSLGVPKQERWMAAYRPHLNATVLIGVGAAFDYHAGTKQQAPLWVQHNGLEWLFRLITEPRRLWYRYFTTIPPFIFLIIMQLLRTRNSHDL
jgi:N-acetylglucosaminyldiphosphoundecaprenol N-acetyl-beta-D-mannosaminyltransferase